MSSRARASFGRPRACRSGALCGLLAARAAPAWPRGRTRAELALAPFCRSSPLEVGAGELERRVSGRGERASAHTSPNPHVQMWITLWINASAAVFTRYTAGIGLRARRRPGDQAGRRALVFWRRATARDPSAELCTPPAGSHEDYSRLSAMGGARAGRRRARARRSPARCGVGRRRSRGAPIVSLEEAERNARRLDAELARARRVVGRPIR